MDITRRLGMRYIWIDAPCIVQDDIDDWREEGSKMASIYSGSHVTIAASKSADSAGGCFAEYAPADFAQTYEFFTTSGQKYDIAVRGELSHPVSFWDYPDFPIFRRAWVLRERLLSPRTIHFGPREVLWECHELKTCEWGNGSYADSRNSRANALGSRASVPCLDSRVAPATRWRLLVAEYSRLRLSDERDIFPAIQGLARYFHGEMQCAYCAGLWESTLVEDLLWSTTPRREFQSRPKSWRAPTWSWASASYVSWVEMLDWQALATVVAISIILVGSESFGEISGGELQLKGRCIDAMLIDVFNTNADDGVECGSFVLKIANGGREVWLEGDNFSPDCAYSLRGDTTSKLVELGKSSKNSLLCLQNCYLVLQCVDEEHQVYERIGLVSIVRLQTDARISVTFRTLW